MDRDVKFSLIIPFYNEEDNIEKLHKELVAVFKGNKNCEVIYVNDGSTDNSFANILKAVENTKPEFAVKAINIFKNVGQSLALKTGIDHSTHETLVFMDGDLQNDPKDIFKMLEKYETGYDLVQGVRMNRQDDLITKIIPSVLANFILRIVCGSKFRDLGCSLKIFNKQKLDDIVFYHGMHRVLALYYTMKRRSVTELPVNHRKRTTGKSKYGLSRIFEIIFEVVKLNFFEKDSNLFLYLTCLIGMFLIISGLLFAVAPENNFLTSANFLITFVVFITGIYSLVISASLYILRSAHMFNKKQQSLEHGLYVKTF